MESPEDEAFNEIERRAKQRMEAVRVAMRGVEDDDIQIYQRPWVGLTDDDDIDWEDGGNLKDLVKAIEAKLKEKNT
jgi:hypothetical protein